MPKVTIIVPVYNAEKTLARCLESLLHQTYKSIEILMINDGSTDESEAICRNYETDYPCFHLITQKNSGPATARNNGIDHANGEYISFVDADDYVEPEYISAMIGVAEGSHADMVICAYYEENGESRKTHTFKYKEGLHEGDAAKEIAVSLISDVSEHRIPPYSWVRMVRKEVFNTPRIRYTDGMIRSEDYFLYTELHFRLRKVYLLSETPLYHYIENQQSVTHTYVKKYWESVAEIYEGLKERLPKEDIIRKNLDIMLIRRAMIALNNASRAEKEQTFQEEAAEIVKDRNLNGAIQNFTFREGLNHFGPYYVLMRLRLYKMVCSRYAAKRKK